MSKFEVQQGALIYLTALNGAGGEQLKALVLGGGARAVCAALYAAAPYELRVPVIGVPRLSVNLTPGRVAGSLDGERARS